MCAAFNSASIVEFSCSSRASAGLSPADLLRIAQEAWCFNSRNRITGELRFEQHGFVQSLEGACDVVLPLVARILADRRHESISIRAFGPVAVRRFEGWRTIGLVAEGADVATAVADAGDLHILPHADIGLLDRSCCGRPSVAHGILRNR